MPLETIGRSALLGVTAERRNQIRQPTALKCDGCGVTVYCSKPMIEPARQSAKRRGHPLYIVCRKCGEPFLAAVAAGDGELEGTPDGVSDVLPEIYERRRQFLRSN